MGALVPTDGELPRYAAIDVGTNSVKLYVAERQLDGSWRRVEDRVEVTRLGERLAEKGSITPKALERTASAVADMVDQARAQGALEIAIVGTAVFRIAANGPAAAAAIAKRAGVAVEVLSGEDEGRLAYLPARSAVPSGVQRVVVFDTGGGSSQLTFGVGERVVDRFSVNVGAVRYTERFALDGAVSPATLAQALAVIRSDLQLLVDRPRPDAIVGIGGAATNIAAVALGIERYDPDAVEGTVVTIKEVLRQIEMYRAMSPDERGAVPGLQPGRAPVILAGASIVLTIVEASGAGSLVVSDRGLRHGVLLERFGNAS
jgi:exopolyphosphatase/guanosine-5'-triphosphate,3'-diphosphate pyrophosphatase